ncbi:MAG TPA: CDP-diacylglycerol--serine O-phosphatidyltransferase, partial [Magnetospirillum sp.]|nr:CDP-diacylglycerol--serine O-phosphatidyltransferase [Magnetospirillum sp.]
MFKPRPHRVRRSKVIRPPRIPGLSINRLIPNILTLLALCAGLTSIRFGLHGAWEKAVLSIILAGILDGLDGRVARLLQGTSKFGAELDSLSDFVSFGVAPAMLLYFWTMQGAGGLGWAMVLLYTVCCGLRLARFNTMLGQADLPPYAYNFFTGVPAPAAAGVVLLPMVASFEFGAGFFNRPTLVAVFLLGVSFLMVSTIPTFSFKKVRIPNAWVLP